MSKVEVVSIEDDGYYSDKYISGSCVKVTLQRGDEFVRCGQIVLWEEEYVDDDLFDEWMAMATDGEDGYECWVE